MTKRLGIFSIPGRTPFMTKATGRPRLGREKLQFKYLQFQLAERVRGDECWIWPFRLHHTSKYGQISFDSREWHVHRLVLVLLGFEMPASLDACHTCDNPPCFNPKHLFPGSTQENIDDMIRKGRMRPPRGETVGLSKLKEEDIRYILRAPRYFGANVELARKFRVSESAISSVIKRKTWKHVVLGY